MSVGQEHFIPDALQFHFPGVPSAGGGQLFANITHFVEGQ